MSLYFDKGANRSLSNLDAAGEEKFTDKQDTLVSGENIKTINGVSVLGEGNIEVGEGGTITVNQTYDPTSSNAQAGKAVKEALDYMNGTISNCILEIPHNIKLEDNGSGTITLKAGSVITDASSTYSTITTTQDVVFADTGGVASKTYLLLYARNNTLTRVIIDEVVSGATDSLAGLQTHMWFDTTNKIFYHYSGTSTTPDSTYPYPLAIISKEGGSFYKIQKDSNGNDMIFNGTCFVGHHAVVYPNIVKLMQYGIDEKNKLKSRIGKTTSLTVVDISDNTRDLSISYNGDIYNNMLKYTEVDTLDDLKNVATYSVTYCREDNNIWINNNGVLSIGNDRSILLYHHYENGVITKFDLLQPYEGARDLLTDDKQTDVTTLTGYDSTKTQTLKNVNGTLTWVDD